jgi:hypothetical protein
LALQDAVVGVGCLARDTVAPTGTDIIFLSSTGVRSVLRTIQEKTAPLRDLSRNVRSDLMLSVATETLANIKSIYSPRDAFYLLTLPSTKSIYCFDMKAQMQDGSARVTTWDSMEPKSFCCKQDGTLLIGKAGYVGTYSTYQDNGTLYRLQYYTNHTDLGTPSATSILKRLSTVVIGGDNQYVVFKWGYDFKGNYQSAIAQIPSQGAAEYGIAEYNTTGTEYQN